MKNLPPILSEDPSFFWQFCRNAIYSLLFPWHCPGCEQLLPYPVPVCEACVRSLKRVSKPFCIRCGDPFPEHWRVKICPDCRTRRSPVTRIRSVFCYEGLVRQMIRDAKYRRKARPLRFFGEELFLFFLAEMTVPVDVIVPVPLHRMREWERTFNQAEILASEVCRLTGLPFWQPLRKIKPTPPQSLLSGTARRANLSGTFRYVGTDRAPRSVLLIDDVVTTGATLEECSRVLRAAGVRRIYGLTVARAVQK